MKLDRRDLSNISVSLALQFEIVRDRRDDARERGDRDLTLHFNTQLDAMADLMNRVRDEAERVEDWATDVENSY
jgi:hypothetical protein